ncbi:MAG: alpha/beta fold hydrolase [Mogibacterium sp.]|nr:alpha/beta fold hydrolase [Mogibacterium sp.]
MSNTRQYPQTEGVFIPGNRGRLFSTVYLPAGGPAPVVIVCHGLPGIEKMIDYAHALREAGFAVVCFHYSGSWGADGTFSVGHCLEDADSVIDYVAANANSWFNTDNVFVIGHSLGGLVASYAIASRPEIKGGVVIMPANIAAHYRAALTDPAVEVDSEQLYSVEFGEWLNGFNWDVMKREAAEDASRFDLCTYGVRMADKDVLLIAGARDFLLPEAENLGLLRSQIEAQGKGKLQYLSFDTDHGMNTCRDAIKQSLIAFCRGAMD